MALSSTVLSALIKSKADVYKADLDHAPEGWFIDIVAEAIVEHITSSAVVTSTVVVASVSGVTAGVAVSGPGAGTATGTVS